MGLRCLIGHDYGPPETEREREERGGEVVVTVREFKACQRCGDRRIISENKEVRPSESTDRSDATGGESADPSPTGATSEQPTYDDVTAEEDDGVILPNENEPEERPEGEWPEAEEEPVDDEEIEPSEWPDAGEEDVQTADTEGSPAAEWPERDREKPADEESSDPQPWPEARGEDEGFDAVVDDESDVGDVEFGGGLTPERVGGAESAEDTSSDEDTQQAEVSPAGITSDSPGPEPTGQQLSEASVETILVCPECDHTASGDVTSLRPGDICPECRRGYLTERDE